MQHCSGQRITVNSRYSTFISLCGPFLFTEGVSTVIVSLVYIHPKANVDSATSTLVEAIHWLQSIAPDTPNFIMADFNHCKPGKSLNKFLPICDLSYQEVEMPGPLREF